MYQAYDSELLNQKESETSDSGQILDALPQHPLFVATRRLVNALDRLEGNLKYVRAPEDKGMNDDRVVFFERENTALKEERESLNQSIADLQLQYSDLHRVAATIYGKLDDSIKKLTQIIEE